MKHELIAKLARGLPLPRPSGCRLDAPKRKMSPRISADSEAPVVKQIIGICASFATLTLAGCGFGANQPDLTTQSSQARGHGIAFFVNATAWPV